MLSLEKNIHLYDQFSLLLEEPTRVLVLLNIVIADTDILKANKKNIDKSSEELIYMTLKSLSHV